MSKYKNKDGIELNYTINDIQSTLTKEEMEDIDNEISNS